MSDPTVRSLEQKIIDALGFPNEEDGWPSLENVQKYSYEELLVHSETLSEISTRLATTNTRLQTIIDELSDGGGGISQKISDFQEAIEADLNNMHTQMYNLVLGVRSAIAASTAAIVRTACPCSPGTPVLPISVPDDTTSPPDCDRIAFYLDWFTNFVDNVTVAYSHGVPVSPETISAYEANYIVQEGTVSGQVADLDSISVVEASMLASDILQYLSEFGVDSAIDIGSLVKYEGGKEHLINAISTANTRGEARNNINAYLATKTDHHGLRAEIVGLFLSDRWLIDIYGDIAQDTSPYTGADCSLPVYATSYAPTPSCAFVANGSIQDGNARAWIDVDLPENLSVTTLVSPSVWEASCSAFIGGSIQSYAYIAIDGGELNNCYYINDQYEGFQFTLTSAPFVIPAQYNGHDVIAVVFATADDTNDTTQVDIQMI